MTKELEALKGIKQAIAEHLHKQTGVSVEKHFEYLQYDTEISIVEQALTPPTADEVCKALSEHYKKTVYYTVLDFDIDRGFVLQWYKEVKSIRDIKLVSGTKYRLIFYRELPPHLITMIGKFYESLEGEKNE